MWKLVGHKPRVVEYEVLETYRRNVGMTHKKLFSVSTDDELPPGAASYMRFRKLRSKDTGELFWAKEWLDRGWPMVYEALTGKWASRQPHFVIAPVDVHDSFGMVFPYYDIPTHRVFHFCQRNHFGRVDRAEVETFRNLIIDNGHLPKVHLGALSDFQTTGTAYGLAFLDFAPYGTAKINEWLRRFPPKECVCMDKKYRADEVRELVWGAI